MWYQVIALENEAYRMVTVRIPVPVLILFGRDTVDNKVAAIVTVKSADNIQQRCLTRTAGAENSDKLIIPEIQAYIIKRGLFQLTCHIFLFDIFYL